MTVTGPEPCSGVYVQFYGVVSTSVGNQSAVRDATPPQAFLVAAVPGDELARARHRFPFATHPPGSLPPSCSRSTARGAVHVAYTVAASIERPADRGVPVLLRQVFLNIEQTSPTASNENFAISDKTTKVYLTVLTIPQHYPSLC